MKILFGLFLFDCDKILGVNIWWFEGVCGCSDGMLKCVIVFGGNGRNLWVFGDV